MTHILNLTGAIQEVRTARTNKEKIEAVNRLVEEFYRTLGILFYTRYLTRYSELKKPIEEEITLLIRDYLKEPTFDSWMRLGKLCVERLCSLGDTFTLKFSEIASKELEPEESKKAKEILTEIHRLKSSEYDSPKKITYINVLEGIRLLRNFRSHEWDTNSALKPLVDVGIQEFIYSSINYLISHWDFVIFTPVSVCKRGIETITFQDNEKKVKSLPAPPDEFPEFESSYIQYYAGEDPFRFKSPLIKYKEDTNRCYVYLRIKKGDAFFESIPIVGGIEKCVWKYKDIDEVFGLSTENIVEGSLEQTLKEKFGKISIENGVIHNLPEQLEDYIHREHVEKQLLEKLSHRRLYLTTLDGGGGFGKTELAKEVVWSIIKGERVDKLPKPLKFRYVIWVTGKVEYFQDGVIDTKKQSFRTVEDLIDSILYVTGNLAGINKTLEEKKKIVGSTLNKSTSTLLLLDNLETVAEKDLVWQYLVELGNAIETDLRVLITSRTRGGSAEQRLNVRAMEPEEAQQLAINEMKRLDVPEGYIKKEYLSELIRSTGAVPLLIRHSVNLISHGHTIEEIIKSLPKDSDQALNFICNFQWSELPQDAKKLLMGVAYYGGQLNFAQSKLLCNLSEKQFSTAKEQLQDHSFLIDQKLLDSILNILPPIGKYAKLKLSEFPEIEEEFIENRKLLDTTASSASVTSDVETFTDEIALNQLFQRAELLVKRGDITQSYQWYKQATDRFPQNPLAWRSRGDFEYRYFEDGTESFTKAIDLAPKDAVTYNGWAYWEFDRGAKNSRKLNLKRSIELNEKALRYSTKKEDIRRTKDFIASAFSKLGYITRDEINRIPYDPAHFDKRKELFKEKEDYFKKVISIYKENIIETPSTQEELHHNVIDYNGLATAYLRLGTSKDTRRDEFDTVAVYYVIQGLKIDRTNLPLLYTLGHYGIGEVVLKYDHSVPNQNGSLNTKDPKTIDKVLNLETKIALTRYIRNIITK